MAFGVTSPTGCGLGVFVSYVLAVAVILEFTRATNALVRCLYELYSNRLMPIAASWVSGDRSGAYRYLPRSVVSFLSADRMCAQLHAAGFVQAAATPLSLGVVTVYIATRS
jgi:demethylmenaquinone methyltransferase/2-methoxy-6-polyprenyl-1,4-benzoquinol methylase